MKKTCSFFVFALLCGALCTQNPVHFTTCAKFWKNDAPIPGYRPSLTTQGLNPAISITYPLNAYQDGCLNVEAVAIPNDPNLLVKVYLDRTDSSTCLNGISIADLVALRQHILGIAPLSLYGIIAADVNRSGSVTTLDMVYISKRLLGITENFPGVPAWRFFPKDYPLSNPSNPFIGVGPWPEHAFGSLEGDTLHFVGLRTGDVDGDANPSLPCSLRPIADSITLSLPDVVLPANVAVLVPVVLSGEFPVAGFQLEFSLDQTALQFNKFAKGIQDIPTGSYFEKNGKIRVALFNDPTQLEPVIQLGKAFFFLEVKANKEVKLRDVLRLDDVNLRAELIRGGANAKQVYAMKQRYNPQLSLTVANDEVETKRFSVEATPNPFAGETQINLTLEQAETVVLEIIDPSGRVTHRQSGELPPGKQALTILGESLPMGGIGFYRILVGNKVATGRLMRLTP